jgi:restriction endonuclease S subunit
MNQTLKDILHDSAFKLSQFKPEQISDAEHVTDFNLRFDSEKRILFEHHEKELARTAVKNGDVLLTIKGRIGNAAISENVPEPVNINQDVALLRFNDVLPLWYIVAYINSRFGKLQSEKMSTGAINPFLGLSNVLKFEIPQFDREIMDAIAKETKKHINLARSARQHATQLLDAAKRTVEIAIEKNEDAAMTYLSAAMQKADEKPKEAR